MREQQFEREGTIEPEGTSEEEEEYDELQQINNNGGSYYEDDMMEDEDDEQNERGTSMTTSRHMDAAWQNALGKRGERYQLLQAIREKDKRIEHLENQVRSLLEGAREPETESRVLSYARMELFRKVKFITSEEQLADLQSPTSIGLRVLKKFGVDEASSLTWWNLYKRAVHSGITMRRNDVFQSLRKTLKGT